MKFLRILAALLCVSWSGVAFAQTQPLPQAVGPAGQYIQSIAMVPCFAPAGGGVGTCTFAAPDKPFPVTSTPFVATGGAVALTSGSGASLNIALTAAGPNEVIYNSGTFPAWVNFGSSGAVTAGIGTTYYVPAGQTIPVSGGTATWIAAYGVGGATALFITPGTGNANGWGGGSGGGGGGVVTQPTAANLNATVVGTVTSNIGTTNGLALDATLSTLSGKFPTTLGAKTSANSLSIVFASDQLLPAFAAAPTIANTTFASTAVAGGFVDGALATEGLKADTACATGATACSMNARLSKIETQLEDIITPQPVKIDQTTVGTTDSVTVKASEVHKGEFGGNQISVQVIPTVTAAAFTSGWAVGGLQTVAGAARVSGGNGLLQSVSIDFKSTQTAAQANMDLFVFSDTTLSSTCTNAAAFVLSATDFPKLIGVVHVTDTTAGNATTLTQALNLAMPFKAAVTSVYVCAVTRGTPTWGTTSDLSLNFNFIRN